MLEAQDRDHVVALEHGRGSRERRLAAQQAQRRRAPLIDEQPQRHVLARVGEALEAQRAAVQRGEHRRRHRLGTLAGRERGPRRGPEDQQPRVGRPVPQHHEQRHAPGVVDREDRQRPHGVGHQLERVRGLFEHGRDVGAGHRRGRHPVRSGEIGPHGRPIRARVALGRPILRKQPAAVQVRDGLGGGAGPGDRTFAPTQGGPGRLDLVHRFGEQRRRSLAERRVGARQGSLQLRRADLGRRAPQERGGHEDQQPADHGAG